MVKAVRHLRVHLKPQPKVERLRASPRPPAPPAARVRGALLAPELRAGLTDQGCSAQPPCSYLIR